MKKICIIVTCLLLSALLVVGGCKTVTETVTKTATQPAVTVTSTVSGGTVTSTITQPGTTVTVTGTSKPTTTTSTSSTTTTTTTSTTQPTTTTSTGTTTSVNLEPTRTNTQPQSITSADGKLQILKHQGEVWWNGQVVVTGTVKNISSSTASAEINAEIFGWTMQSLATGTDTVSNIPAGGSRTFEIKFTIGLGAQSFNTYTISLKSV